MRSSVSLAAVLVLALSLPAGADQTIRWQMTLEGAKKAAAQTNQLVLIHFWAPYCTACRKMEAEVFGDPAVAELVNTYYVPVKLNTEYFPATANQFGITSLPTDVILSPQGQVIQRLGLCKTAEYAGRLQQVVSTFRATSNPPPVYAQLPAATPGGNFPAQSQTPIAMPGAPGTMAGAAGVMPGNVAALPGHAAALPGAPAYNQNTAAPGAYAANQPQIPAVQTHPAQTMPPPQSMVSQPPQQANAAGNYGPGMANPYGQSATQMPNPSGLAGTFNAAQQPQAVPSRANMPGTAGAFASPLAASTMPNTVAPGHVAAQPFPPSTQQVAMNSRPGQALMPTGGIGVAANNTPPSSSGPPAGYGSSLANGPAMANNTAAANPSVGRAVAPAGLAAAAAAAGAAGPDAANVPPGNPPLGLDGFCPVSLAERQSWVPGDRRWGVVHRGRTYLFARPEDQQRFFANPDNFAPVMSGIDIVMALEQGVTVPGQRQHGVYYENKIYLFSTEETLRRFEKSPDYYSKAVLQAFKPTSYTSYR